jgi:hypothetical protein
LPSRSKDTIPLSISFNWILGLFITTRTFIF